MRMRCRSERELKRRRRALPYVPERAMGLPFWEVYNDVNGHGPVIRDAPGCTLERARLRLRIYGYQYLCERKPAESTKHDARAQEPDSRPGSRPGVRLGQTGLVLSRSPARRQRNRPWLRGRRKQVVCRGEHTVCLY